MYVLYQQGIGISNVYFLHVATILWLFISTNSIVRIRSGLDRKVAKNKTEPSQWGTAHSKKLSRSLSSEAEQKAELEERQQKMHVKKRPLNPNCCSYSHGRGSLQPFYGLLVHGSLSCWQAWQANWIAVRSPCRAWMRFYVWPSELSATATEHTFLELWVQLKLC